MEGVHVTVRTTTKDLKKEVSRAATRTELKMMRHINATCSDLSSAEGDIQRLRGETRNLTAKACVRTGYGKSHSRLGGN